MARIRAVLKWDRARNLGWAIADGGTVFYVRRKNFRHPPIVDLRDGMVLEFSKLMNYVNFVERLYEGKERDNFSGNHRKPRPRGRGDFGKNALAVDITIVDGNLGRELEGLDFHVEEFLQPKGFKETATYRPKQYLSDRSSK